MPNPFDVFDTANDFDQFDGQQETPVIPEVDQQSMSWGDAVATGAKNIPESAGRMVKDMAYPFTNFDEFSTGMKKLFSGDDEAIGALKQMLVDRYGGEEQLKRTVSEDPVGLLSDLSLVLSGGGAAFKGAGALAKAPAVSGVGRALSGAGAAVDPVNAVVTGAGKAVGGVGRVAPKLSPEGLYASSLKKGALSSKTSPEDLTRAAQTGLKYDIPLSMKGSEKVESILGAIDNQIGAFIDGKAAVGDTIKRVDLLKELHELKSPGGYLYDTPYRNAVTKRVDKTMNWVRNNYPDEIPVKTAQNMKVQMQNFLSKQYGTEVKSINVASDKAYARGARLALAEQYPELDMMNMTAKELHEFEKIFDPALTRVMSRDVAGIGGAIKTGAGATIDQMLGTGGLFATTGALQAVLDTPRAKAWLARRAYQLRNKKATQRNAGGYVMREGLRQSGRTGEAVTEE